MNNNKGFSLVELVIAIAVLAIVMTQIGSLMINCSTLYKNGTYEAELQTEAQRVTQIIEELLVDADVSVTSTSLGGAQNGSDQIVIKRRDSYADKHAASGEKTYTIAMEGYDPTKGYGKLYVSDGVSKSLLADYVEKVVLNTSDVSASNNNIVTLGLAMKNVKTKYGSASASVSKNIYLRNNLGTKDKIQPPKGEGITIEGEVLRYGSLSISQLFKAHNLGPTSSYTFSFVEPDAPASSPWCTQFYSYDGSDLITPTDVLNRDFNENLDVRGTDEVKSKQIKLHGTSSDSNRDDVDIILYTVPVSVGVSVSNGDAFYREGQMFFYATADSNGAYLGNYAPVTGISVSAQGIGVESSDTFTNDKDYSSSSGASIESLIHVYKDYSGSVLNETKAKYNKDIQIQTREATGAPYFYKSAEFPAGFNPNQMGNIRYYIDVKSNSIVIYNQAMDPNGTGVFYNALQDDRYLTFDIDIKYDDTWGSGNQSEIKLEGILAPTCPPGSKDAPDKFWKLIDK